MVTRWKCKNLSGDELHKLDEDRLKIDSIRQIKFDSSVADISFRKMYL